jgi:hypothetical protein
MTISSDRRVPPDVYGSETFKAPQSTAQIRFAPLDVVDPQREPCTTANFLPGREIDLRNKLFER